MLDLDAIEARLDDPEACDDDGDIESVLSEVIDELRSTRTELAKVTAERDAARTRKCGCQLAKEFSDSIYDADLDL